MSIDATPLSSPALGIQRVSIVGIGASAGGLDAFARLLQHLRSDAGLAYVLVQHLDPTHESLLAELLGRASTVPVVEASDGMRIEVDHAYVIPPNRTMTVVDGHLRLAVRKEGRRLHLPVDAFFQSLAEVHGSDAIGVILSGAGSDGAKGIEAIKEVGGITIAQDLASAHFPSMPQSAVDTGAVDFILTPEEIADQLSLVGLHIARSPDDVPGTSDASTQTEDEALRKILALLYKRTGVDFQHYRRGTVHRRILRRMLVHRQETAAEYLAHLRLDPAELDVLYEDLLIGVTQFFRDPEVFSALEGTAFAAMMERHKPGTAIRMWVPGCASGQETYSLAMALLEFLDGTADDIQIQIFGTDLSEMSIARARAALYPATIADQVSPARLERFFVREEGGYRIAKMVRDLCVFSRQNILSDPPFSHLDLVSCRNVFIYLEPALQRRIFPIFHYALEDGGLLLLGSAESAVVGSEYFEPMVERLRIFRRRAAPEGGLDFDVASSGVPAAKRAYRTTPVRAVAAVPPMDDLEGDADRAVLARLNPPGVVVNEFMQVVQFRGDTRHVLAHAPGKASLDLLKLVRSELVMPLHAALREARTSGTPVRDDTISIIDDGVVRRVAIDVIPFRRPPIGTFFYVVMFPPSETGDGGAPDGRADERADSEEARDDRPGDDGAALALRAELEATKRYLHDIIEQAEATTEELRAANEEIQSSNEELQSSNEELETTKEEVQSTNEELMTLNEELRHRNRELSALSSDLSNLLASTTIPIVIIGGDLRLRRFTPATERIMRVIASDAGRPLSDVKLRVSLDDLEREVTHVIETLETIQREVRDDTGRWWELTVRPYQTLDRRVDGAVLVFADIDVSKRFGEQQAEVSEARRHLLDIAESERSEAQEARHMAEAANKAKGVFLANVSHDLRTPLNAITGYTEILEQELRGPLTDGQRHDLARIKSSARYLLSLINDILNFAKVQAGRIDLRMGSVAIAPLITELQDLMTPQFTEKALQFQHDGCDVIALADPEKVRQILLNLLSNAAKFTPVDGRIGVTCAATADVVRIEVWDTGRGIPTEQLERIFEPFVQVERGYTTPPLGGVGLGLAISRDLARVMNGDLTVDSTVGVGSRFALTLRRG